MAIEDCDVFLSFGGEVRNNFTCHLNDELKKQGYKPFFDRETITNGDEIVEKIKNGIKCSKSAIVIFSHNYASSGNCLNELELILERRRTSKYFVIPIFYHVKAADVKCQLGKFGEGFEQVKQGNTEEKVEKWKAACAEAGHILGDEINEHDQRMENKIIADIVTSFKKKISEYYQKVPMPDSNASILPVTNTNAEGKVFGTKLKNWVITNPKVATVAVLFLLIVIAAIVIPIQINKKSSTDGIKSVIGNGSRNSTSDLNTTTSGSNLTPGVNSTSGSNTTTPGSNLTPEVNSTLILNNSNETTTSGHSNATNSSNTTSSSTNKTETGMTTNSNTKTHSDASDMSTNSTTKSSLTSISHTNGLTPGGPPNSRKLLQKSTGFILDYLSF